MENESTFIGIRQWTILASVVGMESLESLGFLPGWLWHCVSLGVLPLVPVVEGSAPCSLKNFL